MKANGTNFSLIYPLDSSACMFKDGIMDVLIDPVYKIWDFSHVRAAVSSEPSLLTHTNIDEV